MGLLVGVEFVARQLDGSAISSVSVNDLTFNADPAKVEDEVPLALAAIREATDVALAKTERRLEDWATAIRAAVERQNEETERRHRRETDDDS